MIFFFTLIMVVLAIVGGYIITSLLLFKYPHILHKKKNLKFRCRHISHRGGAGENLENTISAFKHAVSQGTDMLELDCQMTKDGQVVVSHDNNLERLCGLNLQISDCDYEKLPLLKAGLELDFYSNHVCLGSDRKIPLLKEVFEQFPRCPINIDIKVNNDELISKVYSIVKEYNREDISGWGNRSDQVAQKLYKQCPDIPLIFSMKRVAFLIVLFYTGLLPFVPLKESLLEIIMPRILIDDAKFAGTFSRKEQLIIKILDLLLMRPALFEHLKKRGIQTYLWVLNTEEEFERAFKLGADGVMTDFPSKLREFIASHPGICR